MKIFVIFRGDTEKQMSVLNILRKMYLNVDGGVKKQANPQIWLF